MNSDTETSGAVSVRRIGSEQRSIIVIDGFLADPKALKSEAAAAPFQPHVRFFPGVQAPFAFERMERMLAPHNQLIRDTFELAQAISVFECGFALVTTPPARLAPLQRIPHIDTTDPHRIAVLCYISGEEFGGTAFYRHQATGYEFLDDARNAQYNAALDKDVERLGVPAADYIAGDTEIFKRIEKVDAKPGRAIIYASNSLHSGCIENSDKLSRDVTTGRLTLNAFLRPAGP